MNMQKKIIILIKWIPALIIFGISIYLSHQSTIEKMPSFLFADKIVHIVCFAFLSFWVSFACNISCYKKIFIAILIVIIYGIIDEIHQSFIPGRSCSFLDWFADCIGAFLGSVIFVFIRKILKIYFFKKRS